MRTSKFVRIDANILLEYIYDDSNLISEPYSIVFNNNNQVYSFLSSLPETNNYLARKTLLINGQSVTTPFTNQLVALDTVQGQYGRLSIDTYSFLQKKDYGISIPIRYDKLRIWLPVNYVFGDFKGCYVRVYTMDFNNVKFIDLSNYFFNISDINQADEIQYASQVLVEYQVPWGKYLEIQFPSPTKVSDQRRNNITRDNTINYNLSEGVGLSKESPVFVDFLFITGVQNVNNNTFYNLSQKRSVSFPQTPEFEKLGVIIEPSDQGDYFLIYPTYNGTVGEFNQFIEQSIIFGNRYYLDYTIEVFEKNILSYTQRIVVTEDFIEELEFRPILKYTTTTAIIDVTCKLIDAVDSSELVRKASYALLQDKVSNFSRFLTKIDLTKATKVEVYKIKGIATPNLDSNNPNGIKSTLKINKSPFIIYDKSYNIAKDPISINYLNKNWIGNRQLSIKLFPYDNVIKFTMIIYDGVGQYIPFDFSAYDSINFVFRSDKKTITIDTYKDSDQNDPLNGSIVFKINMDKYVDIKKIYTLGFNTFYITGLIDGNSDIIYTGFFIPWDIINNITQLNNIFDQNKNLSTLKVSKINSEIESNKIQEVKEVINSGLNKQTSSNTSELSNDQYKSINSDTELNLEEQLKKIEKSILDSWSPYWKTLSNQGASSYNFMLISYEYQFNKNLTNGINKYQTPTDIRGFAIKLLNLGLISKIDVNKATGQLSTVTQAEVDKILGYFKIYNFNPMDTDILQNITSNSNDINDYLKDKRSLPQKRVIIGANLPPTKDVEQLIRKYLGVKLQFDTKPRFVNIKNLTQAPFKNK